MGQDKQKAFDLLSDAANSGHPRAQINLAVMYEKEVGFKDLHAAKHWYTKAHEAGDKNAGKCIERVEAKLSDEVSKHSP